MRERTSDVVFPQALVKRQAFSKRQEFFGWPTTKSAVPQRPETTKLPSLIRMVLFE